MNDLDPPPRSTSARPDPIPGRLADMEGRYLLILDLVVTLGFLAVTLLAGFSSSDAAALANLTVVGIVFLGTCLLFVIGFLLAAARSRDDDLHLAGLFYLSRTAPDSVRRAFMAMWFAQIAIGILAIVVTSPPFGVMATMFGVFANMVWAARHGRFRPHPRANAPGAPESRPSAPQ